MTYIEEVFGQIAEYDEDFRYTRIWRGNGFVQCQRGTEGKTKNARSEQAPVRKLDLETKVELLVLKTIL